MRNGAGEESHARNVTQEAERLHCHSARGSTSWLGATGQPFEKQLRAKFGRPPSNAQPESGHEGMRGGGQT